MSGSYFHLAVDVDHIIESVSSQFDARGFGFCKNIMGFLQIERMLQKISKENRISTL